MALPQLLLRANSLDLGAVGDVRSDKFHTLASHPTAIGKCLPIWQMERYLGVLTKIPVLYSGHAVPIKMNERHMQSNEEGKKRTLITYRNTENSNNFI